MYGLGPTEFPMTRAYVYTILPSLFSSMKLSSPGEVIGTVLQDRATAISGRLGAGPRMIPVSISLERRPVAKAAGQAPEPKRSFKFSVVNDPLFGPLMTYATLLNTLMNYERNMEAATFSVHGTANIRGHEPITFDNIFAGDQSSVNAAAYVISPVVYLMGNDFEKVDVDGLDLSISTVERPQTAVLERAWLDDPRPRAGRTVPLKVLLRTYRGADEVRTIPIQIPANASGSLSLLVSDGARLGLAEQRESRSPSGKSVDQVIRSLNKGRRNNTLYVKLLSGDAGAVVSGEALSALPPPLDDGPPPLDDEGPPPL
jgi:hypothetical protein